MPESEEGEVDDLILNSPSDSALASLGPSTLHSLEQSAAVLEISKSQSAAPSPGLQFVLPGKLESDLIIPASRSTDLIILPPILHQSEHLCRSRNPLVASREQPVDPQPVAASGSVLPPLIQQPHVLSKAE